MSRLKVRWLSPPVAWKGRGIGDSWAHAMDRQGWSFAGAEEERDVYFLASESQLNDEILSDGKPVVCFFWGWPPGRFTSGSKEDMRKWGAFVQERIELLFRCAKVLVPGPVTMDQARLLGLTNTQMLLPGVDAEVLDRGAVSGSHAGAIVSSLVEVRHEILFLSRLEGHKGLQYLIEAMTLLTQKPHLHVVGPGDPTEYKAYADKLGVATTFNTEASDDDKVRAILSCQMLCHPSEYEGFGMPPLEALYLGKPVLASGIPQLRWLLRDTVQFAETVPEIAEGISWIFSNYPAALEQAKRGQERVHKEFTLDHAALQLTDVLHLAVKADLGEQIRQDPSPGTMRRVYEIEHKRNADTPGGKVTRFDPTWSRHWRAEAFVTALTDVGARVIGDIGCGPVYPTIFARAGFKVRALDIADEALRQVREIADTWGVPGADIETFQGRAQELPWADESLDAVVLGEILEHVTDPEVCLAEAWRVTKNLGAIVISTPIGEHHWDPMHIGPDHGGWDEQHLEMLIAPYADQVVRKEQIAEGGAEPSCWLVVLQKDKDIAAEPQRA